jgi:hypothetical protein
MDFKRIQEQEMKSKEDFLLVVRAAIKKNQIVLMMLHNIETGEFAEYSNDYGIDFDEILSDFTEMPFIGHIPISKAFEEWQDYFENPDEAEIYGFELDDGEMQMAILDNDYPQLSPLPYNLCLKEGL